MYVCGYKEGVGTWERRFAFVSQDGKMDFRVCASEYSPLGTHYLLFRTHSKVRVARPVWNCTYTHTTATRGARMSAAPTAACSRLASGCPAQRRQRRWFARRLHAVCPGRFVTRFARRNTNRLSAAASMHLLTSERGRAPHSNVRLCHSPAWMYCTT